MTKKTLKFDNTIPADDISQRLALAMPKVKLPASRLEDFGFTPSDLHPRFLPKEFVETSSEEFRELAKIAA